MIMVGAHFLDLHSHHHITIIQYIVQNSDNKQPKSSCEDIIPDHTTWMALTWGQRVKC